MNRIFVSVCAVVALFAQGDQARFTGTVTDATGAVIVGASINVTNTKTNQTRTFLTSEQGVYFAPGLLPSTYRIDANVPGFSPRTFDNIELGVGQTRTINIELSAAALSPKSPSP